MNRLNNLFIFAIGAAVGSIVTLKIVEKKYEQLANEEIESVKETYSRIYGEGSSEESEEEADEDREVEPSDVENLADIITTNGYGEEEGNKYMDNTPEVIPPDEYGDIEEYECDTLYYYPDGVLTDTYDNIIEDVEGMVGEESLHHFGEWEDDSVFVRNDDRQTYYEILLQADNYNDKETDE